jgi:hypothetical protein
VSLLLKARPKNNRYPTSIKGWLEGQMIFKLFFFSLKTDIFCRKEVNFAGLAALFL